MENYLPPGYRFYPTEEELVQFYLQKKLDGMNADLNRILDRVIPTLDIYEFNPWDLPQFAGEVCQGDTEQWFFFIPRKDSEARGGRPRRLTTFGYWKATGSPGCVYSSSNRIVGLKRTMVFYKGRAPNGSKTEWKMNEYKVLEGVLADHDLCDDSSTIPQLLRQEYSLCRVYKKSKILRAFDRRPTAAGGSSSYQLPGQGLASGDRLNYEETTTILSDHHHHHLHHHHQQHQTTCNNDINLSPEVERTTTLIDSSSPNSSSSSGEVGRRGRISGSSGHDAVMLPIGCTVPLWDWINN
ncbi:NAC domain-containing protein 90-like [Punica granatum]|uniref:NAC domain-containing protein 90-like n=1 Tax=Punica granatum TaxID=22663 RepID=A0A218XCY4_PUNGR|nr:NAC domain-containing protein 90-like [Punica granatum]OWM82549.1 hypothetical protein CDL15_Pgr002124 [Punica granatum]